MNALYSDTTCSIEFVIPSVLSPVHRRVSLGKELTARLINAGVRFSQVAIRSRMNWEKHYVNVTYSVYEVNIDGEKKTVTNMKEFCAKHFTESYGYVINRLRKGGYKNVRAKKIGEVSVSYPKSSSAPVAAYLLPESSEVTEPLPENESQPTLF